MKKNLSQLIKVFRPSSAQRHWLDFLFTMTEKEIKVRYKRAILGFLWIILNPLLQMAVIGFVFQFFVPVDVENYFLFLFTGLLPWNFFSMSVSKTTPAIVHQRFLIKKAKFSREAIVLSIILSNLFHFIISLGLFFIVLAVHKLCFENYLLIDFVQYLMGLIRLVPLIIWLFTLTSGLSLLTAALDVRYRDVDFIVKAVLPLWFYATPVIYTLDLIPATLHSLFFLNPVTVVIECFRAVLLGIELTNPQWLIVSILMSVIISLVGWRTFKRESRYFDDWL